MILLARAQPRLAVWLVAATLAFNLLTPARHVIEGWDSTVRIFPIWIELGRLKRPPPQLTSLHLQRASKLSNLGDLSGALAEVETAARIGPSSISAKIDRGILLNRLGRTAEAADSYDDAVRIAPTMPDVYALRSRFRRSHGEFQAAEQDLRSAVDLLPVGSPHRTELERELGELRRRINEL
jgi:tetratricopeptide (TPR) repeat protein